MPKYPTAKSRYPSLYSHGEYITGAKFICEMLCQRKAYYEHKDLPQKFWTLPEWKVEFRKQITMVNKLLKEYKEEVIIKALRDPKGRTIFSIGAPHLKGLLEKYASMPEITVEVEIRELEENLGLRKPMENTKSLRSKLDD